MCSRSHSSLVDRGYSKTVQLSQPGRNARRRTGACDMRSTYSVDDLILNYDPEFPQERFLQAGLEAAQKSSTGRLPGPVPWPQGHAPTAAPLSQPPADSDDLSRFRGYDAVVVTWMAA